MMKGLAVDENMSNLTSVSSEISASSANKNENASTKRKRNLPGHPDPEAEVIALTPQTLIATNRFLCEICNKGFQRDQNLQLHKRGHNLPWKLKKRNNNEVIRKKVYVCPEPTCVHHDPLRALGDLTGIKKHFFRKHGEKKWKCDKCSKKYAVQSDWKAHSKICGTREYKCDCGTPFSRRDSFITHRAFCEVLSHENNAISMNPQNLSSHSQFHFEAPLLKKEEEINQFNLRQQIPSWFSSSTPQQQMIPIHHHQNPNPTTLFPSFNSNNNNNNIITSSSSCDSPHMSATALLQKASQIGVTMNKTETSICRPHLNMQTHVPQYGNNNMVIMPSREEIGTDFSHCLESYGNKAAITSHNNNNCFEASSSVLHDQGFVVGMFDDQQRDNNNFFGELVSKSTQYYSHFGKTNKGGGANDDGEMTKDFLSLAAFSQRDQYLFNIDDPLASLPFGKQNQNQTFWRG